MVERNKLYLLEEAIELVKQTASAKFCETVDFAVKLAVDSKKLTSPIRGSVSLPAGSGKKVRVAVIAKGEKLKEAEEGGADVFGDEDLVKKIQQGFSDFEVLLATPQMMGSVASLGKILGPQGLMPNPKTGTVTFEITKTIKEFKAGKIEFKMDKGAVVHLILGKVSFTAKDLKDNFFAILASLMKTRPSGFGENYLRSITLSSSMGPGIKVNVNEALAQLERI